MAAHAFHPEPIASDLAHALVSDFLERSPAAQKLAEHLLAATGSRFRDALDVLSVGGNDELSKAASVDRLRRTGDSGDTSDAARASSGSTRPRSFRCSSSGKTKSSAGTCAWTRSSIFSKAPRRRRSRSRAKPVRSCAARSSRTNRPSSGSSNARPTGAVTTSASAVREGPGAALVARHLQAFRLRPRPLDDPERGFEAALGLVRAAQNELGETVACELFFEAERRFYTRKNRAARVQKARQDALGLGWFNRDHHTYRSSRAAFRSL